MAEFVKSLICASEKAAVIARAIRKEEDLFSLLVEEKNEVEKNKRFYQDFKTLADILIQQVVAHDVGNKFLEIAPYIKGEENNKFTNTLGETVIVEVKATVEETASLLTKVLNGNTKAAYLLASCTHQDVDVEFSSNLERLNVDLSVSDLGIWIDPIDSTGEYIHGKYCPEDEPKLNASGLHCVTVLIGAYNRKTGQPIVGVVNQPFHKYEKSKGWNGRYFWGVSRQIIQEDCSSNVEEYEVNSEDTEPPKKIIVMSSSESENLKTTLANNYELVFVPGAGYKQLCVALGMADAYILSKPSTYKWDSCAPHALLKALGGGVLNYHQALALSISSLDNEDLFHSIEVKYNSSGDNNKKDLSQWCNDNGVIAFKNMNTLKEILILLKPETITEF